MREKMWMNSNPGPDDNGDRVGVPMYMTQGRGPNHMEPQTIRMSN